MNSEKVERKPWAVVFRIMGYRFEQGFNTRGQARIFKEKAGGFVRDYRRAKEALK